MRFRDSTLATVLAPDDALWPVIGRLLALAQVYAALAPVMRLAAARSVASRVGLAKTRRAVAKALHAGPEAQQVRQALRQAAISDREWHRTVARCLVRLGLPPALVADWSGTPTSTLSRARTTSTPRGGRLMRSARSYA